MKQNCWLNPKESNNQKNQNTLIILIIWLISDDAFKKNQDVCISSQLIKESKYQTLWFFDFFDFLLIFDLKVQPKKEIELLTICEHNDEFPQIFVSSTLTLVEVGCMYTISINQRNQKNQNLWFLWFFWFFD